LFLASLCALGTGTRAARADEAAEKAECIAASDQAQQSRDDGRYTAALQQLARCARPTCPALVRNDCTRWRVEVEDSLPSIVVDVRDDKGTDLVDVTVTVDGQPLASKLDGKPLGVDPGPHVFRFEAAGTKPEEEHIVIRAGERNRMLNVRLASLRAAAGPAGAGAGAVSAPGAAGETPSKATTAPRLTAWIFGGVAAAAFANEAYFGVSGMSQRSTDLGPSGCATLKTCSSSEKGDVQTKFVVADVSLGVGIVSAGLAAFFFLSPRSAEKPTATSFDLLPRPGGGIAAFRGHF
jgi:hypothetical protein